MKKQNAVAILARVGEILAYPEELSRAYWPDLTDEQFLETFFPGCMSEMTVLRRFPEEKRLKQWEELTQGEIYWPELKG